VTNPANDALADTIGLPANFAALTDQEKQTMLRDLLQRMVWIASSSAPGEKIHPIDFTTLSTEELKITLHSLSEQLAPYYMSPTVANGMVGDGLDKTDVGYHTFLRLWQVFGYVLANGSSSDASNDASSFNQAMSNTSVAWTLGLASALPIAIGMWIRFEQMKLGRLRNSVPYQIEQLLKVNPEALSEGELLGIYYDFLERGKVKPLYLVSHPDEAITDAVIGTNAFADAILAFNGNKKDAYDNAFKAQARRVFSAVKKGWNFLVGGALAFWPIWMVAVLIIGIGATYVFPALPIIVGITFAVTIAIQVGLSYYRARKAKEAALLQPADPQVAEAESIKNAEKTRMLEELKQRAHMRQSHAYFNKVFKVATKEKVKSSSYSNPYLPIPMYNERVLTLIDKPQALQEEMQVAALMKNQPVKSREKISFSQEEMDAHQKRIDAVVNTGLGLYLLGSKTARRGQIAVNMVNDAIGYYTLSAFVLWLTGATLWAFAPLAAAFVTVGGLVLGSIFPAVSTAFNALIGVMYSLQGFAETRNKQLAFEQNVYLRLSERYKNSEMSKAEAFAALEKDVNQRKAALQEVLATKKKELRKWQALKTPLDEQQTLLLNYDLNKIDVYRYSRAQQEAPSTLATIKNGLFGLYKAVNAGQTWIFVTRSLFLAGAALGGVCLLFGPGSVFVFLGIAAAMAVIGIAFKLTQIYLDQKAREKAYFLDMLDPNLAYLEKMNKELKTLEVELGIIPKPTPATKNDCHPPQEGNQPHPDAGFDPLDVPKPEPANDEGFSQAGPADIEDTEEKDNALASLVPNSVVEDDVLSPSLQPSPIKLMLPKYAVYAVPRQPATLFGESKLRAEAKIRATIDSDVVARPDTACSV